MDSHGILVCIYNENLCKLVWKQKYLVNVLKLHVYPWTYNTTCSTLLQENFWNLVHGSIYMVIIIDYKGLLSLNNIP